VKQKKKNRALISLEGLIRVCGTGLAITTVFGWLGGVHWFLDLFSHFRVQYMQLCLVLIAVALWKRMHQQAIMLVLLAALNYAFVLPLYVGKPVPQPGTRVRVMLMNINAGNGNTAQVLGAIRQAEPDLLLLQEVTPKWAKELTVLNEAYPYRIAKPQEGCFGIMLLSRHPLSRESVVEIGSAGVPSIITDVHLPDGEIGLIGTHPLPPTGAAFARERNTQLAALPGFVQGQKHPVLLVGDLNTSPWSPHFTRLLRDSGLKNSMKGFGFQPTWPTGSRFLRIPIDHLLHAPEINIHSRAVGGHVGSDHFPVTVDFSLK
jgi:endonuclease/exonuclease/phosphatase (EEP) superfamily protein YafD